MSRTIHINLLKNHERRSSMPVRTRVMVPVISSLVLLCLLVWSLLLSSRNSDLKIACTELRLKKSDLQSAESDYHEIKKRETIARSELAQFESYKGGQILFADVFAALPHVVPETMQLASLDLKIQPRPVQAKNETPPRGGSGGLDTKKPAQKETVIGEAVILKLSGFVESAASIDALRAALRVAPFTNLVVNTEIPRGAFRISGDRSSKYIFEVNCECIERVFK